MQHQAKQDGREVEAEAVELVEKTVGFYHFTRDEEKYTHWRDPEILQVSHTLFFLTPGLNIKFWILEIQD